METDQQKLIHEVGMSLLNAAKKIADGGKPEEAHAAKLYIDAHASLVQTVINVKLANKGG